MLKGVIEDGDTAGHPRSGLTIANAHTGAVTAWHN